jgi:hypothetical protein
MKYGSVTYLRNVNKTSSDISVPAVTGTQRQIPEDVFKIGGIFVRFEVFTA